MAFVYIYVFNKGEITPTINVYEVTDMAGDRGKSMCHVEYICPKKPDDTASKLQYAFVSPHPMTPMGRSSTVNLWSEKRDDEKAAKLIAEFRLKGLVKAEALAAKRLARLEQERDILVDGLVVEPRMRKESDE